jgi:hypothetical protein
MTIYRPSYDTSISDLLKKRFSKEIEIIEQEGFRFFSLHQEINWPFSVILFFPVYVLMANNEHVRVEAPLRISSYHLMYVSDDGATFAYIYGLGCKFYTKFMDGTWLVSNTAQSAPDEKVVVQKREPEGVTTEQAWNKHKVKLLEYQAIGMQPVTRVSFGDWVEIESRFDRSNVNSLLVPGLIWMIFLGWAIYWIVMNGTRILDTIP